MVVLWQSCGQSTESAFTEGGVHLVIASVDDGENVRVLVDELRANAFEQASRS